MKTENLQLLISFSLVLLGLVMLVEAALVAIVLQQITPLLTQNSATIAWGYTLLKIVAGIIAVVSGVLYFVKMRD